jgi:hypothetical protein
VSNHQQLQEDGTAVEIVEEMVAEEAVLLIFE